jgi:hypothetical protein
MTSEVAMAVVAVREEGWAAMMPEGALSLTVEAEAGVVAVGDGMVAKEGWRDAAPAAREEHVCRGVAVRRPSPGAKSCGDHPPCRMRHPPCRMWAPRGRREPRACAESVASLRSHAPSLRGCARDRARRRLGPRGGGLAHVAVSLSGRQRDNAKVRGR